MDEYTFQITLEEPELRVIMLHGLYSLMRISTEGRVNEAAFTLIEHFEDDQET